MSEKFDEILAFVRICTILKHSSQIKGKNDTNQVTVCRLMQVGDFEDCEKESG
jgi:hypothetical protein